MGQITRAMKKAVKNPFSRPVGAFGMSGRAQITARARSATGRANRTIMACPKRAKAAP